MTFEDEFLAKIAKALNVPAELIGADYDAMLSPADLAYRRLVRFYEREMEMEAFRMQGAITNAIFAAYIKLDTVQLLVGYDPQKLLPSPETIRPLSLREWAAWWGGNFAFGDYITRDFLDEEIVFHGARPKQHVNFKSLYPDATPTGRYRRETPYVQIEHKMAVIRADVDFAALEERILASIDDPRVRCIVLDIESGGGDIIGPGFSFADRPRNRQAEMYALGAMMEKPVATAAGLRDKSYLDHDPTKKHKRRKRK